MNFSKNLQKAMDFRGYSPEIFAELSGLNKYMIIRYLEGKSEPNLYTAFDIASALGVSLDWLTDRPYHNNQEYRGESIGDILNHWMKEYQIPSSRFAEEAGITYGTLTKLRREDSVRLSTIIQVADYMEISLDYLIGLGIRDHL